jgi:anaerobic magnesium-protoporphyrin IX monomethyl ester cyclase
MRWYSQMGRRVWPYEILNFLRDPLARNGPTVGQFWGAPQDAEEESMTSTRVAQPVRRAHQIAHRGGQIAGAAMPAGQTGA